MKFDELNKKTDFQDDFLAKYEEFSESWRAEVNKMKRFWLKINLIIDGWHIFIFKWNSCKQLCEWGSWYTSLYLKN